MRKLAALWLLAAGAWAQDVTLDVGIAYSEVSPPDGSGQTLRLDLYRTLSDSSDAVPLIVLLPHGELIDGRQDPLTTQLARGLATTGGAVIALDYRLSLPDLGYADTRQDLHAALDWAQLNAETLNLDLSRVVLVGFAGSSDAINRVAYRAVDGHPTARISRVVALWPEAFTLADVPPDNTPPLFVVGVESPQIELAEWAAANGVTLQHHRIPSTTAGRAAAMQTDTGDGQTVYQRLLAFSRR